MQWNTSFWASSSEPIKPMHSWWYHSLHTSHSNMSFSPLYGLRHTQKRAPSALNNIYVIRPPSRPSPSSYDPRSPCARPFCPPCPGSTPRYCRSLWSSLSSPSGNCFPSWCCWISSGLLRGSPHSWNASRTSPDESATSACPSWRAWSLLQFCTFLPPDRPSSLLFDSV